jgi:hypothetical protein
MEDTRAMREAGYSRTHGPTACDNVELNEVITIRRPARDVFAAWARLRLVGLIGPLPMERKDTGGAPLRDGGRLLALDHWPGRDVRYGVQVTVFEPPDRIAAIWSDPLSGGFDVIFESFGETTELHYHAACSPSGLTGVWLRPLGPWCRREARRTLLAFRDTLERGSAGRI